LAVDKIARAGGRELRLGHPGAAGLCVRLAANGGGNRHLSSDAKPERRRELSISVAATTSTHRKVVASGA
jgi:hypothetical protein